MKKFILAFLLLASPAFGQVKQSGNVTPGHAAAWTTIGVIQDGGNAAIGSLTSLGVTASGAGICQNSGPVSSAYNQLCFNVTQSGGGVFSLYNYNGASGGLGFSLNGVTQGLGIVALPVTVNDAACIANSSGNLKDCGAPPGTNPCSITASAIQYEASSTAFGCIANWTSDGSNIISNRTTANIQFETTGNNAFLWAAASQTLAIGSGGNNSGGSLWLGSISLRSNLSSSAWTTSGIRYANVPVTLTDTTSSGTIAAAYTNVFGGDTIAASSATVYTNYYGTYFTNPVAGTNATLTNGWALGADSAKIGNLTVTGSNLIVAANSGINWGSSTSSQIAANGTTNIQFSPDGSVNAFSTLVSGGLYYLNMGAHILGWTSGALASAPDIGFSRSAADVVNCGNGSAAADTSCKLQLGNLVATAAAPTVATAQIGYGSTVTANTNCGTIAGSAGCVVINVAGTTRYIPYY